MKNKYIIAALLLGTLATGACKKIPDGNLSNIIRYEVQPSTIQQGRAYVSTAINPEGSTKPLNIKLVNVYNRETGENVTPLFEKTYAHKVWKALYDPKKDTTLEQINAKRIDTMIHPIVINPVSGQIEANYTTVNLPLGKYKFDLEISNPTGTKFYKDIGSFDLVEAPLFEIPAVRSTVAMKVGAEGTTKVITSGVEHIRVTRTSETGDKVIVKIVDKNGNAFNPSKGEIARRPNSGNTPGFLQTMQDYAISTQLFDDRMEFAFGVVPFPLNSLGNGFNYYYRIPAQYVKYDDSLGLPYNTYSCNARFSFRTYAPGTYLIEVIVPQVTRVP
ncbi:MULTISPECIES: DUF5007 domain-containing protein [Sphingobacterium]|uniref:DUF5007 domain-containing protein n=1 Tax=Sphingobacterium tenebrionis TaxID=3111775 RepID=A0ABU8I6A2_9SPHI|nr:DUF5007 domain-containing protein [Sphingobacterium sp. 1.A.4]